MLDNPEEYPLNERTHLGVGDLTDIGVYTFLCGFVAFVGRFVLGWYEGEWGAEYYAEENSGLLANFDGMLNACLWIGIVLLFAGGVLWYIGNKKEGAAVKELRIKCQNSMHRMINWLHGWDKENEVVQ